MQIPSIKLLRNMLLIRIVEEQIAENYSENEMRCPTHLSIGQEASASGVGLALKKSDLAVSTHRSHAHYLAKGGNLKSMIAEIYGKETGCSKGRGGSMHLIDSKVGFKGSTAIVGNSMPIGVGLGLSLKIKKQKSISVIFCGDGSIEEGVFFESINFSATKELPVLFVCENNLYSVYSSLSSRQPKDREIYKMVEAMGVASDLADGNNVEDVYKLTKKAVTQIKEQGKPRFIELSTYRWLEHCGPNFDNDIGYRSPEEFKKWKKKDPIKLYIKTLLEKGIITKSDLVKIKNEIQKEVQDAFNFAKKSPFPDSKDAFRSLFA